MTTSAPESKDPEEKKLTAKKSSKSELNGEDDNKEGTQKNGGSTSIAPQLIVQQSSTIEITNGTTSATAA